MELNEGIRLLTGKAKIDIPLKKMEEKTVASKAEPTTPLTTITSGPVTSKCTVEENGKMRTFTVTIEPISGSSTYQSTVESDSALPSFSSNGEAIYSSFSGTVDVVDILVKVNDTVKKGTVVAKVEAMKATHDIKSHKDGTIKSINVSVGDEVDSSNPIMTIS